MPPVPDLRSPYARVGRLVYFGRMLDKIRLHAAGLLPPDYLENFGDTRPTVFDGRCCRFLGVSHATLVTRTLQGGTDVEILAWTENTSPHGRRSDEECEIWNAFLSKRGWRDPASSLLRQRIRASGLTALPIETMFDYLDFDEGRDPVTSHAWEIKPLVLIVMGVCGCGKSTVGQALAASLGWPFADADAFHPPPNRLKMTAGQPLDDADRGPWLDALHSYLAEAFASDMPLVLACSALRQAYRDRLVIDRTRTRFIHLKGTRDQLLARLIARTGHFMPASLLDSQLATLEEPADALLADITLPVDSIIPTLRAELGL